jgi:hypothetical protein
MKRLLMGAAIAAMLAGPAHAACTQASADGAWDFYITSINPDHLFWDRCVGTISNGALSANCTRSDGAKSTISGKLSIQPNCRVTAIPPTTLPQTIQTVTRPAPLMADRYGIEVKQAVLQPNGLIIGVGISTLLKTGLRDALPVLEFQLLAARR